MPNNNYELNIKINLNISKNNFNIYVFALKETFNKRTL